MNLRDKLVLTEAEWDIERTARHEAEARVEQLEDAIRDILDFAAGWSRTMSESARLGAIHFHGSAALEKPE